MSDHDSRDHFADGPRDENFAEFADELRLLAEAVLERVEPVLRKTAADGRTDWSSCSWCPVCAAAALVRGEHHDVVAAIADHGTSIVTVLREALAGVPVEPVVPPELDPDSPEYAAAHQHSHTNGSSDTESAGNHGPDASGGTPASAAPQDHRAANPDAPRSNSPTGSPASGAGVAGGSSFWSNVAANLRSPGRDSGSSGPAAGGTHGGVPEAGPSGEAGTHGRQAGTGPSTGDQPGARGSAIGPDSSTESEPAARGEYAGGRPGQDADRSSSRTDWFTSGGKPGIGQNAGQPLGDSRRGFGPAGQAGSVAGQPSSDAGRKAGGTASDRAPGAGRGVSGRGAQGAGRQAPARPGYVPIPVTIKPPTT